MPELDFTPMSSREVKAAGAVYTKVIEEALPQEVEVEATGAAILPQQEFFSNAIVPLLGVVMVGRHPTLKITMSEAAAMLEGIAISIFMAGMKAQRAIVGPGEDEALDEVIAENPVVAPSSEPEDVVRRSLMMRLDVASTAAVFHFIIEQKRKGTPTEEMIARAEKIITKNAIQVKFLSVLPTEMLETIVGTMEDSGAGVEVEVKIDRAAAAPTTPTPDANEDFEIEVEEEPQW